MSVECGSGVQAAVIMKYPWNLPDNSFFPRAAFMRKGFLKLAWEMFASCQVPSKAGEKKKAGETESLEKGGWGWGVGTEAK